ncbi:uncharacterized protein LOC122327332 isoform X2 [Puntigrus tetrazona]|uniref:uncharacterized protein LOC122327332 isoform X2 n=1 Tax=Puntigrus tetrazona TaxID=1606681 RepID=UPI001C8912C0|nr:uncharacterized protein LOC122327332 isoform X2 [Puntigrus tetrazona]
MRVCLTTLKLRWTEIHSRSFFLLNSAVSQRRSVMKLALSVILSIFVFDGVFGVDPDEVKTVIEGDSVALQTDFTEMQKDGITEWTFSNANIASINKGTGKVEYSDDKLVVIFSGRLTLDQTGFLTIWNIRIKHSGEYKVESISTAGTKSKTFKVIVKESPLKSVEDKDEIKVLSATKGNSETLHTETELQEHDLILWRFRAEGYLIAKGDTEDNHTSYYNSADGRFRDRLKLDSKTGSLTITDLDTEHTGEFRLKIISDRRVIFKRFTVTVSVLGLSPGVIAGICVGVLLLVAAVAVVAVVMIYCQRGRYKLKYLMSKVSKQLEQMTKMTEKLERMTKTNEKDLAKISEQLNQMDEANVRENVKNELYGKLKQMSEGYEKALPEIFKQLERLREQRIPEQLFELSEQVNQMSGTETSQQETCADVPQEETPRPEVRGERERRIFVEETPISKALGAGKILRDSQGRKSIAIRAEDDEDHARGLTDVKISEQESCADVPQEETPRSETGEGERERIIYVEETPISKVLGADKRLKDRQGKKSIVIRKNNTEDPAVQTHEATEKAANEETPLMNQKEEDGPKE